MNIEFMKQQAISNILSVSGKEKTSEVVSAEIDKIVFLVLLSKGTENTSTLSNLKNNNYSY